MYSRSSPCCIIALSVLLWQLPLLAEEAAGKTIMARGSVQASAEQQSRALKRQSPVFGVDLVSTGPESSSQLRMKDGGLLSMHADSELAIRNYPSGQGGAADSVSMDLLKGGLRTITGTLPQSAKDYQLNTPVATIGVRGTHYEAVLQQGDLYLAGWDGIIDIRVTVPGADQSFSLGPEQPFRFAIVRANGEVELLLRAPTIFAAGQPGTLADQTEFSGQQLTAAVSDGGLDLLVKSPALAKDASGVDFYDNSYLTAGWGMDTITRSGIASFDQLSQHSFSSTAGSLSNLSMSMEIDFDSAWVPSGQLSFIDAGGEWFATFNGVFGEQSLELFINFASHGNQVADGSISGVFINDATAILGNLSLAELDQPSVRLDGGFVLTEQP
ncbi:hypothetical protein A5320_19135 [Rheinheimera sp. SA_1]|uniref:FecR family protein n=1 Tax=Rheinheimera sp. SA_1 TaxID=1827365 RepID=UPI0008019B5B|nr:FecR family protein [Rheinheimera sp. SA_1]OBP13419.1 hypothetical protein A5320_19135 [Rheinheimera sp. SA_1]